MGSSPRLTVLLWRASAPHAPDEPDEPVRKLGRLILPALERASGSEICSFTIRTALLYSRHELCTQKLAQDERITDVPQRCIKTIRQTINHICLNLRATGLPDYFDSRPRPQPKANDVPEIKIIFNQIYSASTSGRVFNACMSRILNIEAGSNTHICLCPIAG